MNSAGAWLARMPGWLLIPLLLQAGAVFLFGLWRTGVTFDLTEDFPGPPPYLAVIGGIELLALCLLA